MTAGKPPLTILLAAPRGFCAGVVRAIRVVEEALARFGAPVYVRHEIVHNRHVVETLGNKGAVFVEELDEVPDNMPVIFSAHGVPKAVPAEAERRELLYVDATCPLVSKVHREVERYHEEGRHLLLIGHEGHPETVGTIGQLPEGVVTLVETVEDARGVTVPDENAVAYATQTTLSVDDAADIIAELTRRFPKIKGPRREDICYATTNRQKAVKEIAPRADAMIVIGAPNSSNSLRLVEVARDTGCPAVELVERVRNLEWDRFAGMRTLGITAAASAPEILIEELVDACRERYDVTVREHAVAEETVVFKLPRALNG